MLGMLCSRMMKNELKTSIIYLVVIILLKNCEMTFGVCTNVDPEDNQFCSSYRCSRSCNENSQCQQICSAGECTLECNGNCCSQTCSGYKCTLKCNAGECYQTCGPGQCSLECGVANKECKQNCQVNSNSCTEKSLLTTAALTKETANEASTTASEHYHTCQHSCAEPLKTIVTTDTLLSQSSTSSKLLTSTTTSLAPMTTLSTPSSSATKSKTNSFKSENISRTEELVISFLSTLNTTDVCQDSSLQDAVNLLQNTTEEFKNISTHELQLQLITEQEQNAFVFKMAFAFEEFAMKYGQYHLNESNPQIKNNYSTLVLCIERVFHQNASHFQLEEPEKQNFINIPSSNLYNNDSVLLGIVYSDVHELLTWSTSNSDSTKSKRRLGSKIMAVAIDPRPEKLQQNVALNFKNLKAVDGNMLCMFWIGYSKENPDGWSEEGCHVVESKSNSYSEETECNCNHFTHFAVLFDLGDNSVEITKTDEKILKILTYVGLALSIIGIILTMICYVSLTDANQPLSQIRVSLAGSLGAGQIVFLAGINATGKTGACVTVAALMQYFLMAAFCWMLVEGIYLYLLVVKVYNINNKVIVYHFVSWGFPLVMVAISLSIATGKDEIQSFVNDEYCWMSSSNNLIWIFVAFVVTIEVVNMLILVRVIKEMTIMESAEDNHIQQIRIGIKACMVMVPLLGVTWLFGLLTSLHKAFVYIFTTLNSVQGFLIFLLHCVRNSQIKDRFKRRINAIFPAESNGKLATKTSQVNRRNTIGAKAIEVQSCSNNVFELK